MFFLFFLVLFSPFLSFLFLMLMLCFFSPIFENKTLRLLVVSLSSFFVIIIFSSRGYYDELTSDLGIYHDYYKLLQLDLNYGIGVFGGGYEVGWPLLYWLFGLFTDLTPIHLAVLNTVLSLLLIFLWFESKVIPTIDTNERGIFYFFIFLFFNFLMLGFLQRQALTLGFLLFALTAKNNRNLLFFILIASLFHISSVLVGCIIYFSRIINFNKKNIILLCFSLLFLRIFLIKFFEFSIAFISFDAFSHKAQSFIVERFSISTLRYFLLYFLLFPFLINVSNFKSLSDKYIYNYAVLTSISIIIFIGVPLFADRIFMIGLVIYGLLYYKYFFVKNKVLGLILALIYFMIFTFEKFNLVGSLALGDYYWNRFDYFGDYIFYYLEEI